MAFIADDVSYCAAQTHFWLHLLTRVFLDTGRSLFMMYSA